MGFEDKVPIIMGRSEDDIEKYGEKGTGYLSKVVLSSEEHPVDKTTLPR